MLQKQQNALIQKPQYSNKLTITTKMPGRALAVGE